jgi:hypothetical protein
MCRRKFWLAVGLLACIGCASTNGGRTWREYVRHGSEDTPEENEANKKARDSLLGPAASESKAPVPGNALSELTKNEFHSWTVSHRIEMPVTPRPEP